jgi:hypothetical protein
VAFRQGPANDAKERRKFSVAAPTEALRDIARADADESRT